MSACAQFLMPSIAADPVSPEVAPTMVTRRSCCDSTCSNSRADQLQRDVLEREGRPVEQLLDEVVVTDLHERHDGGVGERRVGVGTHCPQRVGLDLVADEQPA